MSNNPSEESSKTGSGSLSILHHGAAAQPGSMTPTAQNEGGGNGAASASGHYTEKWTDIFSNLAATNQFDHLHQTAGEREEGMMGAC